MLLYLGFDFFEFPRIKAFADGELNLWFDPEFSFSRRRIDVYVYPALLAREEEKTVISVIEDSRTHLCSR